MIMPSLLLGDATPSQQTPPAPRDDFEYNALGFSIQIRKTFIIVQKKKEGERSCPTTRSKREQRSTTSCSGGVFNCFCQQWNLKIFRAAPRRHAHCHRRTVIFVIFILKKWRATATVHCSPSRPKRTSTNTKPTSCSPFHNGVLKLK